MLERIVFWNWGHSNVSFSRSQQVPHHYHASEAHLEQIRELLLREGWVNDTRSIDTLFGMEVWVNPWVALTEGV